MFQSAKLNTYDYIDYANGQLTITRNPFGFVNAPEVRKGGGIMPEFTTTATFIHVDNPKGGSKTEIIERDGVSYENESLSISPQKRKFGRNKKTIKYKHINSLAETYTKTHPESTSCAVPTAYPKSVDNPLVKSLDNPLVKSAKKKQVTKRKRNKGKEEPVEIPPEEPETPEPIEQLPRPNLNKYQDLEEIVAEHEGNNNAMIPQIETALDEDIHRYMENLDDPHKGGKGVSGEGISGEGVSGGDQIVHPNYNGVYLNEQGNISDAMFLAQVKNVLRKNNIEISGKEHVSEYNALPETQVDFLNMFVEDGTLQVRNMNLFKKRILGLTSYFRSAQEKLLPRFVPDENGEIYHIEKVDMSDYQIGVYSQIRSDETAAEEKSKLRENMNKNKGKGQNANNTTAVELYKTASSYRIFSRAACNFVFPTDITRPLPKHTNTSKEAVISEEELDNMNDNNTGDMYVDENAAVPINDKTYQTEILAALAALKNNDDGKYLRPEMLKNLSPKFLRILENIQNPENRGLHLVYSNFRSLEGIGIFKLILEANGFAEFKLQRNGDIWEIKETDSDMSKPRFVLYTGTETNDEKEIIRNIYNSQWDLVPTSIAGRLRENAENNYYGEVIRIIMITASGAEGINLANTRFVHIVEPYWNLVRVDQVVGRARRICSHKNLPEEMRTVQVFLYMSTFSATQRVDTKYKDVMKELSRRDQTFSITTDENLYDISVIKNNINKQLLNGIKETAIDCRLYKKGNAETNLVCYGEGLTVNTNEFGIFPSWNEDQIVQEDINTRKVVRKMKKITVKQMNGLPDKVFAKYDRDPNLYDWDIYENSGQEKLVGRKYGKNVVEY